MTRHDKRKRQESAIVQAALDFTATEEAQSDFDELKTSSSVSLPTEYMLLIERCNAFRKFLRRNNIMGKYVIR